jgi:hypothetical protein
MIFPAATRLKSSVLSFLLLAIFFLQVADEVVSLDVDEKLFEDLLFLVEALHREDELPG